MSKLVAGLRATAQVANFAADLVESYGASAIGVISNANNSKKGKVSKNNKEKEDKKKNSNKKNNDKKNNNKKKNGKLSKDNGIKISVGNRKK